MRRYSAAIFIFAMGFVWAATSVAQASDIVGLAKTPSGQNYLVDSKGMTLYYFTKDKDKNGGSACNGNCLKAWPAFYAPTIQVSAPLVASDFGTITRDDGSLQSSYRGWPLYYWVHDTLPGDIKGEGVGKVWYVIDPANFPARN
ncbi:MAG: hypothetical protein M0001_16800 [Treponema sp.]|nr:hypothetical protein [Treponema sp.]